MPEPPDLLDPLTLPLQGSRLIEASAGTGKTWAIAALYLRLVLGPVTPSTPGSGGLARALGPAEILVMSFTRSATRELSDRIRQRLVAAAAWFRDEPGPEPADEFLQRLRARYAEGPERQQAAWRLSMAAEAMDDAAVTTIDAWCQRMLREHAFDSGSLFDEELQANEAGLQAEAARDYWRQQVYPLDDEALAIVLAQWKDVDAMQRDAQALMNVNGLLPADHQPPGQGSLADCIHAVRQSRRQQLAVLRQGWVERADEMQAWLEADWARDKQGALDKRSLKPAIARRWLEALRDWARNAGSGPDLPTLGLGAERLTALGLQAVVKPGAAILPPACFDALPGLLAALAQLPEPGPALRLHAAACVAERVQQLKAQTGRVGFVDLLQRLHEALDEPRLGERAKRLRQAILLQYPAALIDEFQDTSPLQLGIFDRLYRIEDNDPERLLLLIGDPKQAIYGFRGADIRCYLQARLATRGRHHVLGTNHRSSLALVEAVNRVFQAAEQRPGAGAFMFRTMDQDAADAESLPFLPVQATGRKERWVTTAGGGPPLTWSLDPALRSKDDSRRLHAALCAERIVALLNDAGAGFEVPGHPRQRLRPADIAVLVRTGTEAAEVRQALRRRGVATAYLSDKDSVFASEEAQDLLRLLRAVAAPREMRLARAALATPLLGLGLDELVALASDEILFDAQCDLLRQLHAVWQQQGVLAMLRRAVHAFGLPARWLAGGAGATSHLAKPGGEGERRLTNLLHLAELLQAASAQVEGEQAQIRWLVQQVADAATPAGASGPAGPAGGGAEAQVLRLESDADLVQVVTIHKSKGLEYPLVFLPFAAHLRPVQRSNTAWVVQPDDEGERRLWLVPSDEQLAAADHERLQEDLRLLYVALTRARHGLWVGLATLKIGRSPDCVWHRSAIGYLLSGPAPQRPAQVAATVRALRQVKVDVEVDEFDADPAELASIALTPLRQREPPLPLRATPSYSAVFERQWSLSSYSALVKDLARSPPAATARTALTVPLTLLRDDDEAALDEPIDAPDPQPADAPWHRFPRGARVGNFLHAQLEWLAGEAFALAEAPALQLALQRRCEREGWEARKEALNAWLCALCTRPLPPLGVALAGLDQTLPEMEFWYPSDGLDAGAVDALCRRHLFPGRPRPELPQRRLKGLLMGYADLVFQHQGRYGVMDYKSNALGNGDADYSEAAMEAAMLDHRYDVQAALYLLALHRLLRQRLGPAYDPAHQLHGALYFFLRGVHSAGAGCLHLPVPLALLDALDRMTGGPGGAEAAGGDRC